MGIIPLFVCHSESAMVRHGVSAHQGFEDESLTALKNSATQSDIYTNLMNQASFCQWKLSDMGNMHGLHFLKLYPMSRLSLEELYYSPWLGECHTLSVEILYASSSSSSLSFSCHTYQRGTRNLILFTPLLRPLFLPVSVSLCPSLSLPLSLSEAFNSLHLLCNYPYVVPDCCSHGLTWIYLARPPLSTLSSRTQHTQAAIKHESIQTLRQCSDTLTLHPEQLL